MLSKRFLMLSLLLMFQAASAQRIALLSSDVAEIVIALGSAGEVVGREQFDDAPELKNVPVVAMHRAVSAEAVLAVKPDVVLGSWLVQPAAIFSQLQKIGVNAVNVSPKEDFASYVGGIRQIGHILNKKDKAEDLARRWENGMKQMPQTGKRYLISYDGRIVAGRGTVADYIITMAGGINAGAEVEGLKPLSREGWLAAKPDVIILSAHNKDLVGGLEKFSARPEVVGSAAAKNHKIFFLPSKDYMRYNLATPKAVQQLHDLAK